MKPWILVVPHGFQQHYDVGFCNAVARKGLRVDLVCTNEMSRKRIDARVSCNRLGQNKDERRSFSTRAVLFIRYHARLIALAYRCRGAIIHVTGGLRYEWVTGVLEGLIFRYLGKAYVLTVHNIVPHHKRLYSLELKYRLTYKIPQYLVVHTEKMKQDLLENGVSAERVVVMQHGLNDMVPDHGKSMQDCRKTIGVPNDKLLLLFFGNLAPYKGLETLLIAMESLDNRFALLVVGKAKDRRYGAKIAGLVESHSARERIFFRPGWVDDKDVATYFRAADALVMPYRDIDQSGVLFLALGFGTPIIATNVGALKSYIEDSVGVVASGASPAALAQAIEIFSSRRGEFEAKKIRAFSQRFSWDETIAPVTALYGRIWVQETV